MFPNPLGADYSTHRRKKCGTQWRTHTNCDEV